MALVVPHVSISLIGFRFLFALDGQQIAGNRKVEVLVVEAGKLGVDDQADICIFDPAARWSVEPAKLKSQGRNTPFAGYELKGRVRYTLVGGHLVYEG